MKDHCLAIFKGDRGPENDLLLLYTATIITTCTLHLLGATGGQLLGARPPLACGQTRPGSILCRRALLFIVAIYFNFYFLQDGGRNQNRLSYSYCTFSLMALNFILIEGILYWWKFARKMIEFSQNLCFVHKSGPGQGAETIVKTIRNQTFSDTFWSRAAQGPFCDNFQTSNVKPSTLTSNLKPWPPTSNLDLERQSLKFKGSRVSHQKSGPG